MLGRSIVRSIVHTVCKHILKNLLKINLPNNNLPKKNETKKIIQEFESVSVFSQAVAAIDSCQIRINSPNKNLEDYLNRKEYHSIVLQGLVDNRYLFRDIFVGLTRKSHDARIFKNSSLYKQCQKKSFLPVSMLKHIINVELSPLILVDSAYSLENWLMKPNSDRGNLSPDGARFNIVLSKSRVAVENVFARLKNRFQCIAKRLDTTLERTVNIVTTETRDYLAHR